MTYAGDAESTPVDRIEDKLTFLQRLSSIGAEFAVSYLSPEKLAKSEENPDQSFLRILLTSLIIFFSTATHSQPYDAGKLDQIDDDFRATPNPPPERRNAEELRRSEINAGTFDLRKSDYNVYLRVVGESVGTVDINQLGPHDAKRTAQEVSQIRSVLQENKALVGDASGYEFEIINLMKGDNGAKIFFHQKIGDVFGPRSWLFTDGDGKVKDLLVRLIDPSNPNFNKSNWLSETQLVAIAKSAYESQYGKFSEDEIHSTHFDTISESDGTTIKPVMVIHHRLHQIDVNVLTGAVENIRSMSRGQSVETAPGYDFADFDAQLKVPLINSVVHRVR